MKTRLFTSVFLILCSVEFSNAQTKVDSLKAHLATTTDKTKRLSILDDLTTLLIQQNSEEQVTYLKQYLQLTSHLEEYDLMASKSRFLIQHLIHQNKLGQAKALCDSLLQFKPLFKKANSEAHLLLKRGFFYYSEENYDLAIKYYTLSKDLFIQSGDSIFVADAYQFIGESHSIKNDFLESLHSFKKAQQLYEMLGDETYALLAGTEITGLYTKNGFFKKAIEERQHLLQKAKENEDFFCTSTDYWAKCGGLLQIRRLRHDENTAR